MPSIKRYFKALKDYFMLGEAGDAAFGEIKFYGIGANPDLIDGLQKFVGYYPTIDLNELSQLSKGTLGYEYARHMKQNNIQPLEISPDLKEEANNDPFALRYTLTHDIFHVLLGFDTTYAGEMGVFGFTVGQNYSKMLKIAEPVILLLFCLIKPHKIKQIWKSDRLGKALGKQAQCLLVYPFEKNWSRPIADIRVELGLFSKEKLNEEVENAITKLQTKKRVAA